MNPGPVSQPARIGPCCSEWVPHLEPLAVKKEEHSTEPAHPETGRPWPDQLAGGETQLHLARKTWPCAHGVWERTCIECTGKQAFLAVADECNGEKNQEAERVASRPDFLEYAATKAASRVQKDLSSGQVAPETSDRLAG